MAFVVIDTIYYLFVWKWHRYCSSVTRRIVE